ncbi:MAG: phosphoribosylglycinamide synthetase C domain-containing protein, partial [Prochlorococcaceae cyanobacterium]
LMPLLQGDLAEVLLACANGHLDQAPALTIAPLCSACVVAAAAGYPGTPQLGDPICDEGPGLDCSQDSSQLFAAGVKADANGELQTSGGRVLAAVAQGHDFDEAFARAYKRLAQVKFAGMQLRRDIGHQVRRL